MNLVNSYKSNWLSVQIVIVFEVACKTKQTITVNDTLLAVTFIVITNSQTVIKNQTALRRQLQP